MGVTKLWDVLNDVRTDVTLDEIKGLTLAVDLATWICESEGVKLMKFTVSRPYLRNLFFRVSAVLKAGINLVFVLDGKAPELKLETISRRLAASGGSPKKTSSGIRSRLNAKLKECCVLLDSLGIPWIKAETEAEALCGALNKIGLVDGVVTNDGDAFLCGARTVYRNFSVEKNAIIEKYCMDDIERRLDLNQRDLVALGLLLGCDFCPKGVPGVGAAQAVKLLASFGDRDTLEVFSMWRETGENVNSCVATKKSTHCSTCSHEGTKREHCDSGCEFCGSKCRQASASSKKALQNIPCECRWHMSEETRRKYALEEKIKIAALKDPNFPDQAIIDEFLKTQCYVSLAKPGPIDPSKDSTTLQERFKIKSPMLDVACECLKQKLDWEFSYTLNKVLPLVTHFLLNSPIASGNRGNSQVQIQSIVKTRVKDRVQSFEVEWTLTNGLVASAYDIELVTIEPEADMIKAFPEFVNQFYEMIAKEKEEKKKEKAESRKAGRKKLKGSPKKSDPSAQSKKMTDFFKAKKQRGEDKSSVTSDNDIEILQKPDDISSQNQGLADVKDLEACMKSLSIAKGDENSTSSRSIAKKKFAIPKVSSQERPLQKLPEKHKANGPIIVFSSDSDSESDVGDVVSKMGGMSLVGQMKVPDKSDSDKKPSPSGSRVISKKDSHLNNSYNDEITFSNELDFSLGCSLLHATVAENSKENQPVCAVTKDETTMTSVSVKSASDVTQSEKLPLSDIDLNKVLESETPASGRSFDTPDKAVATPRMVEISDSPVFMTLMDRLKARQKK